VTFADDNVWVGNSGGKQRLAPQPLASLRKLIDLGPSGNSPRGVGRRKRQGLGDELRLEQRHAHRSERRRRRLGRGRHDVDLGANAAPYNIGDMTGTVALGAVQPTAPGPWSSTAARRTRVRPYQLEREVPAGTGFAVAFRAANQVGQLPNVPFQPATNGLSSAACFGRFVQIEASFTRRAQHDGQPGAVRPDDRGPAGAGPDGLRGRSPPPSSLLVFPSSTTAAPTDAAHGHERGFGRRRRDVEYVYIGRIGANGQVLDCLETNRTRRLTPRDTITLITKNDNPNAVQGYVYVFAKSKFTGRAIVHDFLSGTRS
jgi:hypothetical protein